MNRIDALFAQKQRDILSVYFTAGFPRLEDTRPVLRALQDSGVDLVEIGMPFSDPLADGPVIQESGTRALANGMTLRKLFSQLEGFRNEIQMPALLMGYLNPVLQYGMEAFLSRCRDTGIDGVILPDLPLEEYEESYRPLFERFGIHGVFLVTPETSPERLKTIDGLSRGFVYAVSSSSTTGKEKDIAGQEAYFRRLEAAGLQHPVLVGFGIRDHATFQAACRHCAGAVIGTAYIRALQGAEEAAGATRAFVQGVRGVPAS